MLAVLAFPPPQSYTKPVVSGAQREANRRAIDKFQGGPYQYPWGKGPVSRFLPAQVALAAVASGGAERQDQGGRRMNNILGSNIVILKRPTVEEADDNLENPITATARSQKRISKL